MFSHLYFFLTLRFTADTPPIAPNKTKTAIRIKIPVPEFLLLIKNADNDVTSACNKPVNEPNNTPFFFVFLTDKKPLINAEIAADNKPTGIYDDLFNKSVLSTAKEKNEIIKKNKINPIIELIIIFLKFNDSLSFERLDFELFGIKKLPSYY